MNKTKMMLAVVGGAMGLVVLVLAFFTWRAYSAKTVAIEGDEEDGVEGLEAVVSSVESLSRSPVYPCAASVTAIESNQTLVAEWRETAKKFAATGDKVYDQTTPAAFKAFLVADAKRLIELPGKAEGHLAKADFAFGPFRDYIVEGKMPAEDQLAVLQRRWDDIALVVGLLSANGAAEITDVQLKEVQAAVEEPKDKRKGKKPTRKNKTAKDEAAKGPSRQTYVFTFLAKPAALVKAINALEVCERFAVVEDFAFTRMPDAIAAVLGGDEKKVEQKSATGRRGRRRGAAEDDTKETEGAEKNQGVVTDPVADAPLSVTLTVSVYDFRSLEEESAETVATGTEKKGASK